MSEGEDRGLALATTGNAFISVWREPSTLEEAALTAALSSARARIG